MTDAKDWITAQPPLLSEQTETPERTPAQKAAIEQLLKDDGELYDVADANARLRLLQKQIYDNAQLLEGRYPFGEFVKIADQLAVVQQMLAAMRPVVDPVKLAEIRARHDSVADMADDEWDNRIYTIADDAFSDRAFLLSAIEGVKAP